MVLRVFTDYSISTVVLKADIKCKSCFGKISQTLWELQAKQKIQTVEFNEDSVTITGPFDRKKVAEKLFGKISKCMLDIKIKGEDGGAKEAKPKNDKPAEQPVEADAKVPKTNKSSETDEVLKISKPPEQAPAEGTAKSKEGVSGVQPQKKTGDSKPINAISKPPEQTAPVEGTKIKEGVSAETKSGDQPQMKKKGDSKPKENNATNVLLLPPKSKKQLPPNVSFDTKKEKGKQPAETSTSCQPDLDCICGCHFPTDPFHQCHCCGKGACEWMRYPGPVSQHAMMHQAPVSQHGTVYPAPVYQQATATYPAPQYSPYAYAGEPHSMCSLM